MKRFFFGSILVVCLAATASANTTYSSTGTFNCTPGGNLSGCGTDALSLGTNDVLITFVGQVSNTVTTLPTGAPFGDIVVSCAQGGTPGSETCGPETLSAVVTLTININETSPAAASGNLSLDATLNTGTLSAGSTGTVSLQWASASTVTLGSDLYSIGPANLPLVPPNSGNPQYGDLSLQGSISSSSVPEPATLSMLGMGLLGFGAMARRKRKV